MPAEWFIPVSQTVCVGHFTSSMQLKESRLHSIFGGSWSKLAMRVVVVLVVGGELARRTFVQAHQGAHAGV